MPVMMPTRGRALSDALSDDVDAPAARKRALRSSLILTKPSCVGVDERGENATRRAAAHENVSLRRNNGQRRSTPTTNDGARCDSRPPARLTTGGWGWGRASRRRRRCAVAHLQRARIDRRHKAAVQNHSLESNGACRRPVSEAEDRIEPSRSPGRRDTRLADGCAC